MTEFSIILTGAGTENVARRFAAAFKDSVGERKPEILLPEAATALREALEADGFTLRTHPDAAGYASACNTAAALATTDALVFLDPACVPLPGWLDAMDAQLDADPDTAVVGLRHLYADGTVRQAGLVFGSGGEPRLLYTGFPADHDAVRASRTCKALWAGAFLARRNDFASVDGFDTAYTGSLAVADLCLRLGRKGRCARLCADADLVFLDEAADADGPADGADMRRFRDTWSGSIVRDDLTRYFDDGLITLDYAGGYPLTCRVSPLLAVVEQQGDPEELMRLLADRSRQVHELMLEVVRLTARAGKLNLPKPLPSPAGGNGKDAGLPPSMLKQMDRREEEIRAAILDLQAMLSDDDVQGGANATSFGPSRYLGYEQMIKRVHLAARTALPEGATVLVVCKGDRELVAVDGLDGWHFPRGEDGYFSHYPADSAGAIAHLEALIARGADYILFPTTAMWWFDHYTGFGDHLEANYVRIVDQPDACRIYELRAQPSADAANAAAMRRTSADLRRIEELLRDALRPEPVAVVRSGNDTLDLGSRPVWQFPQAACAGHAGRFPESADEAVTELERLREAGARYLVVPRAAFWWLERFPEFREYIETRYDVAIRQDYLCLVYDLAGARGGSA